MNGFILERLCPTAWRRVGDIHWGFAEAIQRANLLLQSGEVQAVRILPVRVSETAVWESCRADCEVAND